MVRGMKLTVVVALVQLLVVVTFSAHAKAPVKTSGARTPTKAPLRPHVAQTEKPIAMVTPTISSPNVRANRIKAQLAKVVGSQKLTSTSTPYYKAFEWIVNTDPMKLSANAENLVQRYLMVYLYYSTTQFGPWLSCNPPLEGKTEFCLWAQLVSVFPKKHQLVPWLRWLSSFPECQWAGVFCTEFNQITAFELYGQNLSGTLPVEVIHFPRLQSISFDWNQFRGTLPPQWAQIKDIINIEVHYNFLTGTVPNSWWNIKNLLRLTIGGNMLTGTIPSQVSGLGSIKGLFTFNNLLTGPLPSELGKLKNLTYTRHSTNGFQGTIPTQLGHLVHLEELWLHKNHFKGTIPTQFGQLNHLTDLRAYDNALSGRIPNQFYEMTLLNRVELEDNQLTGTISTRIENLYNLSVWNVSNNNGLSGTIPTQFGTLYNLQAVEVQGNKFHGSIPEALCNLFLPFLEADCSPTNDGIGKPEIYCHKDAARSVVIMPPVSAFITRCNECVNRPIHGLFPYHNTGITF